MLASGVGAAVNVAAALILVPRYGAEGAAVANGLAVLTVAVIVSFGARNHVGAVEWRVNRLVRLAAASAVAAGAGALIVHHLPDGVGLAVGGVVAAVLLAVLTRAFRALDAEDLVWAEGVVGDRFGGAGRRFIRLLSPPGARLAVTTDLHA
jgi:O-antigen/teichoic acid export membrane protein